MEWPIRLEARTGSGAVRTLETGKLFRRVKGVRAEDVGLRLVEAHELLAKLQR